MGITLLAQLASTNLGVSFKRLAPSGAEFNPLNRLKELPKQNVPAALQALALMARDGLRALSADRRQSAAASSAAVVDSIRRDRADRRVD